MIRGTNNENFIAFSSCFQKCWFVCLRRLRFFGEISIKIEKHPKSIGNICSKAFYHISHKETFTYIQTITIVVVFIAILIILIIKLLSRMILLLGRITKSMLCWTRPEQARGIYCAQRSHVQSLWSFNFISHFSIKSWLVKTWRYFDNSLVGN